MSGSTFVSTGQDTELHGPDCVDMTGSESEAEFRCLGEPAQDAIIMTDPHGEVIYWNRAAERMFGYTAREMMGR
jgi:PAS domain-containing protein